MCRAVGKFTRVQAPTSLWPALNALSVRLIESQIKEVKKGKDQSGCLFYRGVCLIEMSIKIESTLMLLIFLFFQQSVRLYDVQNNNMRLKYNHANAVLDCCFQDGVHSYSGGLDSTLKV